MIEARSIMQAVGDVLFTGDRVYRLVEPDRILRVRRIRWDKETSDLEDERGKVYYNVGWDEQEFWDDVEFHLPEE